MTSPTAEERYSEAQALRRQPITVAASLLQQARREAHLTQSEAAKLIGCSQQVISKIETGRSNPTIEKLNAMLAPLGYSLRVSLSTADSHDYALAKRAIESGEPMTTWEATARRRAFERAGVNYDEAMREIREARPTLEPGDPGYDEVLEQYLREHPAEPVDRS